MIFMTCPLDADDARARASISTDLQRNRSLHDSAASLHAGCDAPAAGLITILAT
jgi:hypothetical protein